MFVSVTMFAFLRMDMFIFRLNRAGIFNFNVLLLSQKSLIRLLQHSMGMIARFFSGIKFLGLRENMDKTNREEHSSCESIQKLHPQFLLNCLFLLIRKNSK